MFDWTHPAQPHVVVALLQLQGLQELLHRLESSRANSQRAHKQKQTCVYSGGPHVGIAEAPGGRLTGNHSNKHHSPEHQTQHTLHTVSLQIGLKGPKRTKQVKSDGGPLFRQLLLIMSLRIIKTNYRLFGRLSESERMIFAGKNYFWGKIYQAIQR